MREETKKFEQLSNLFSTKDDRSIVAAIASLRNSETFEGAIGLMAILYEKTNSDEVKTVISRFLNDIKDHSLAGEVVKAIDNSHSETIRQVLISSCWQSGIDYSKYIERFVDYTLEGSYLISLECYSVIEEAATSIEDKIRLRCIERIRNAIDSQPQEKARLLEETIRALSYPADLKDKIHYS